MNTEIFKLGYIILAIAIFIVAYLISILIDLSKAGKIALLSLIGFILTYLYFGSAKIIVFKVILLLVYLIYLISLYIRIKRGDKKWLM